MSDEGRKEFDAAFAAQKQRRKSKYVNLQARPLLFVCLIAFHRIVGLRDGSLLMWTLHLLVIYTHFLSFLSPHLKGK